MPLKEANMSVAEYSPLHMETPYRLRYNRLSPPSPTGSGNEKELASFPNIQIPE